MMKSTLYFMLCLSVSFSTTSFAAEGFFFRPRVAIGHNEAQGTHTVFGVDTGIFLSEQLAAGLGAYFGAGEHSEHDQEWGAGPFVTYAQPLLTFLTAQLRQDIAYVDQRRPIKTMTTSGTTYTHTKETGLISATSLGLNLRFSPNFGISGGYRLVVALSNSDLDDDRSGVYLGVAIGF